MKTFTRYPYSLRQLLLFLALLVATFFLLGSSDARGRAAFDSHEVHFTDASKSGMQIMPASCASNPRYYHGNLSQYGGTDFVVYGGQTEVGAFKNGIYLCVTNTSGSAYFIPGGSAAEMNAFKARNTGATPGLQSW